MYPFCKCLRSRFYYLVFHKLFRPLIKHPVYIVSIYIYMYIIIELYAQNVLSSHNSRSTFSNANTYLMKSRLFK